MAEEEARFTGRYVNQFLIERFPGRRIDFIKNRRRDARYKELVSRLRNNPEEPPVVAEAEGIPRMVVAEEQHIELRRPDQQLRVVLRRYDLRDGAAGRAAAEVDQPFERQEAPAEEAPNVPAEMDDGRGPIRQFLRELSAQNGGWEEEEREFLGLINSHHIYGQKERVRSACEAFLNRIATKYCLMGFRAGNDRAGGRRGPRRRNNIAADANPINRVGRRARAFRTTQVAYGRDRAALARSIIDDKPLEQTEETPEIDAIQQEYNNIFAVPSIEDDERIEDRREAGELIAGPITELEILEVCRDIKTSAAGPDGITIKELQKIPTSILALLYNVMLLFGVVPNNLKANRTTLIPKGGDNPRDVNNWRPITIASIFMRVLHKCLGRRFVDLPIHENQRGFRRIDGVLLNTIQLQTIIKQRRQNNLPCSIQTKTAK